MAIEPFVRCDNLVKIHKVANLEVVALQGLDLVIGRGELVGIVGPSGSGKSTLMNILGGLDRPSAGKAWVDGHDLLDMSDRALTRYRAELVGFVWQQGARNLVSYLNALENVVLPMTLSGRLGAVHRSRAEACLELVGLADRRFHRLSELSGGEQQRVAIAVAIVNQPRLLLADEPTGEVDSETADVLYDLFQRLNRELGMTTLIVSHDPGIARHVDRVVKVSDGRLAAETVRLKRAGRTDTALREHEDDSYEELVVLDNSGRLQIPKHYLEAFGVKGRLRLESTEEGILLRPAPDSDVAESDVWASAPEQPASTNLIQRLKSRWLRPR